MPAESQKKLRSYKMEIKQKTKKNGQVVYTTSLYLGVDAITGKKVRTTITARTKKEVKLKAQHKLAEFDKNGQTVFKEVKITYYHELAEMWYEGHIYGLKPNSIINLRDVLDNYILPAFGHYRLDKLTPTIIQDVVNRWARAVRAKTKSNQRIPGVFSNYQLLHSYNKAILKHAVALELIPNNPAQNVLVPKAVKLESDKVKAIDTDQLKIFLNYLDNLPDTYLDLYDKTLYKFLLATGCRIGEALVLEWSDIDLKTGTVVISKTVNKHREVNAPKSRTSHRTISIDPATIALLKHYKKRQQVEAWQFSHAEKTVFTTFVQKYPHPETLRQRLIKRTKQLGLQHFSFHAFRHTHASLLLNAGVNYKELQERLGHATLAMTMDTYAHLSKENLHATASLYEQALKSMG